MSNERKYLYFTIVFVVLAVIVVYNFGRILMNTALYKLRLFDDVHNFFFPLNIYI